MPNELQELSGKDDISLEDAKKELEIVSPSIAEKLTYEGEPRTVWDLEEINKILFWCVDNKVSDIAIQSGMPIWVNLYGQWFPVTERPVNTTEINQVLGEITRSQAASARLKGAHDLDFQYEIKRDRFLSDRFRCNATSVQDGWSVGTSIIMRSIPSIPPTIYSLNPEPAIMNHGFPLSGLVLVTGVMGSGKSTLLAAMIRYIIETMQRLVITYENPIEFDLMSFVNPKGLCLQTDIPSHLESFEIAPRNSARRAANVILVGESRDPETLRGMLEAAEIGVAAYSTVHTRTIAETPTRIINVFPSNMQNQIAATLISSLRLIVQQRLVPKVGGGRVALREILPFDEFIRDDLMKTPLSGLVPKLQGFTADHGQPMLDDAKKKYEEGLITKETLNVIRRECS